MIENFIFLVFWWTLRLFVCGVNEMNYFLYNTTEDVSEHRNIYSLHRYSNDIETMKERLSNYWIPRIGETEYPDTKRRMKTKLKYGGIVPYNDDESMRDVPDRYSYEKAPHIVFFLVDDWGFNDPGYVSTYLGWTTANIDRLASNGVKFTNHYSHQMCTPARAALLTGRFAVRSGLGEEFEDAELPSSEATLAEELKSAGYKTYMVGKWHLGYSSLSKTPTYRGFDYHYGYYLGFIDYWTKEHAGYLDLHENGTLVSDPDDISSDLHTAFLFEQKAEAIIDYHMTFFPDQPMFLYYAAQLIHDIWSVPQKYFDRCFFNSNMTDEPSIYCGLNLLLDEVVGNLTCKLERMNLTDNLLFVLLSDNGGSEAMPGNNFPLKAYKSTIFDGALRVNGFVHGSMIPEPRRGGLYDGRMHIVDWLPTLMNLATNGEWNGSLVGNEIDGIDMWNNIVNDLPSPRFEIVHWMDPYGNCSFQNDSLKFIITSGEDLLSYVPKYVYPGDQNPSDRYYSCQYNLSWNYTAYPILTEIVPTDSFINTLSWENNKIPFSFVAIVFLVVIISYLISFGIRQRSPKFSIQHRF